MGHIPKSEYIKRFIELDNRGYVWKDKVYQQLVEEFDISAITWEELLQDYICRFKNSCITFPNLENMLGELRSGNIALGIISNGKGQFQMENIEALGIRNFFDVILISEWEGIKKPDPGIFKRAMYQLKVLPDECIYVGDHPENDVKAAQNAGMQSIWKKDFHWNDVDADIIINDLAEVPLIIKNLGRQIMKSS